MNPLLMPRKFVSRYSQSRKSRFFNTLTQALNAAGRLQAIDVGIAYGVDPRWPRIAKACDWYGFDPDPRSQASTSFKYKHVFPVALSDVAASATLYKTRISGATSLLKPNRTLLDKFPEAERCDVVGTDSLSTTTIDTVLCNWEPTDIDFIKLDTQGSELNILRGAEKTLRNDVMFVELEVQFLQIYEGAPLYGDVNSFLSSLGFEFLDFVNLRRWRRDNLRAHFGQCVFGDAIYVRSPEAMPDFLAASASKRNGRRKFSSYLALCLLYGKPDLAKAALRSNSSLVAQEDRAVWSSLIEIVEKTLAHSARLINLTNRVHDVVGLSPNGHIYVL